MLEFARAMREADAGFAARVGAFEARFGPTDADSLSVLAQASYFCWFTSDYEEDFLRVCAAIGAGAPTSLRLCGQVSPRRWARLHTYVVAVRSWLGDTRRLPPAADAVKVHRIAEWLGVREPVKERLAEVFLHRLTRELRGVGLSLLTGSDCPQEAVYDDFAAWYPAPASFDYLVRRARHALGFSSRTDELLAGLLKETQPPCMHRHTRYLDIRLASIGALAWRGYVPPDDEEPKWKAATFLDAAAAQVRGWAEGRPPAGELGETIHRALGAPTDRSRHLALACFLPPKDDLSAAFFDWLSARAQIDRASGDRPCAAP